MQQLDEFWLNLTLGMIGEIIDPADEITGDARALLPPPAPSQRARLCRRSYRRQERERALHVPIGAVVQTQGPGHGR